MAISTPDVSYDRRHFTFDKLDRILTIGQRRQIGAIDLTLLSIECYEAGFSAITLLEQDWQPPEPDSGQRDFEPPLMYRGLFLISDAYDDLGNRYIGQPGAGGSGGGGSDGRVGGHHVYGFAPALDPAARTLTLTLAQVAQSGYDSDNRPVWRDDQVIGGPWTLRFSLEVAPENGAALVSIVPVARQVFTDNISITVTTIERYPASFVVNFRLDWTGPGDAMPSLACYASDDRGATYGKGNCAGGGMGVYGSLRLIRLIFRVPVVGERLVRAFERRTRSQSWRMSCKFEPALDPEASELALEISSLRLRRPVRDETQQKFDHWELMREMSGLGTITIPLQSQQADSGKNGT